MSPNALNKIAFVARVHERRLREIERRSALSVRNPLANTISPTAQKQPREKSRTRQRTIPR